MAREGIDIIHSDGTTETWYATSVNAGTEVDPNPTMSGTETNLDGIGIDGTNYNITDVVANPTLAGTESALTGIEIDGTKYSIPVGGITEVTYSELKTLRDNGTLTPGATYRINDFVTTLIGYYDLSTIGGSGRLHYAKSAEHPYDIIVTADDASHLSETARVALHSGDTYFLNNDLSAWEIKYCLDNDTNRFAWADPNGKGVVWWMKDEFNNESGYDFKNVLFLRYKCKTADAQSSYTPQDYSGITGEYYVTPLNVFICLSAYMQTGTYVNPFSIKPDGTPRNAWNFDIYVGATILNSISAEEIDSSYLSTYSANLQYTFSATAYGNYVDASLNEYRSCLENYIELCGDLFEQQISHTFTKLGLGMNILYDNGAILSNYIGANSFCNTSGSSMQIHIDDDCSGNMLAQNTFGYATTLEKECSFNEISCGSTGAKIEAKSSYVAFLGNALTIGRDVSDVVIPSMQFDSLKNVVVLNTVGSSGNATIYSNYTAGVSTTDGGITWS